jgi:hypothetical protein
VRAKPATGKRRRWAWCPSCDGRAELIPLAGAEAGQGLYMRVCSKPGCPVKIVRLPPGDIEGKPAARRR